MMKKIILALGALVIIGGLVFIFGGESSLNPAHNAQTNQSEDLESATAIAPGTYAVAANESSFAWAGKKPLIDGYTNSGTIDVSVGTIVVDQQKARGTFTLDMNTLHVGLTAKKPGQEGKLEEHLKSDRWFDVAAYPTAKFEITNFAPAAEGAPEFTYTITGNLTMKSKTNEITFPAKVYQTADGRLHAEAETEIDRTKWGITSGSGNFFDNLGDNMISDMVALSFSIIADKRSQ
jgi:polyisoprenoid-binding protein YceI